MNTEAYMIVAKAARTRARSFLFIKILSEKSSKTSKKMLLYSYLNEDAIDLGQG